MGIRKNRRVAFIEACEGTLTCAVVSNVDLPGRRFLTPLYASVTYTPYLLAA